MKRNRDALRPRRPAEERGTFSTTRTQTTACYGCAFRLSQAVLHSGEVDERESLLDLRARHVAQADQLELALAAQVLERAELVRERDRRRPVAVEQAQVDEVDAVDAQRAQVVLDARAQLLRPLRRQPCALVVTARGSLGCSWYIK